MNIREMGKQGLKSSRIGLGCMGMSDFYGERNDVESIKVIHEALEKGITLLDTADMYGIGDNEELVGKAIKAKRNKVVLATKFAIVRQKGETARNINCSPEYVKQACEASLKRLNTDNIDLYYMHRKDPKVEIEETVGAMAELVKEGKVRYLGLSEVNAQTLRRAHAVHPITALQTEYSLWTRDVEGEILDTCRELGIALVAYSPLGRGFLTGALTSKDDLAGGDYRHFNPRFAEENFQTNMAMVEEMRIYAKNLGHIPAQIAIAWVLAKGDDIFPIPGTKRLKYLNDNIKAADIKLTKEQVEKLENIIDTKKVKGLRYPAEFMNTVDL
ncbi:aldo/keto reductase [Denitrovibrio acetiphilus DSM 12809]|uniref:Aldo/keto reductase n=1 Tax=Denitrovibrio acetiphilus (strain DSM 12809 / NBRC 114555 / N2460) TaxID=522772 RepID=D4H0T0_DENA2|nr:aldo/keto reductase [Denitrovibrio acetiphilus]ADD68593.1 aldo/keto reductase [Denitrovibrio acetiphilus DSM 12809]